MAEKKAKKQPAKKKATKKKVVRKKRFTQGEVYPKTGPGRPTDYRLEYCELAKNYCLLGAKDGELAAFFGVSEQTLNAWKKVHPEFLESIKEGKEEADGRVAQSLYHRATGYSHPEDKIFNHNGEPLVVPTIKHYPPDPTAAIFWLKNRQKDKWRDRQEHEHTGKDGGAIVHEVRRTIVDAGHSDG
jgi:hypothetical protein